MRWLLFVGLVFVLLALAVSAPLGLWTFVPVLILAGCAISVLPPIDLED